MKNKYLAFKSQLYFILSQVVCTSVTLVSIYLIMFGFVWEIGTTIGVVLYVMIYVLFAPIFLIRGSATIVFDENKLIYKRNFLAKERIYEYSRMTLIYFDFTAGG